MNKGKTIKLLFRRALEKLPKAPIAPETWAISFLVLIVIRIGIENWLGGFINRRGQFLFYEFSHTFLFFLFSFLVFVPIVKRFCRLSLRESWTLLTIGFVVILFPPLIDAAITGPGGVWSFYEFDGLKGMASQFISFFDDTPRIGITYGVRVEVFLVVLGLFVYVWAISKSFLRALTTAVISYAVLFLLGTFPSWVTIVVKGFSKGFFNVTEPDVAAMFLTPAKLFSREIPDLVSALNIRMSLIYALLVVVAIAAGFAAYRKKETVAFLKNARFPQIFYHAGLLTIGMGLAAVAHPGSLPINFFTVISYGVLLVAVLAAWLASVVANDVFDQNIDRETNSSRPLINKDIPYDAYVLIGWALFFTSVLLAALVTIKGALLLATYQALAWIYSAWPFRLKRFLYIGTFVSSLASLAVLYAGFVAVAPDENLSRFPGRIALLLVIGYTLSLGVKDLKDVEGDRKEGVYTIPVVFGEVWGRLILAGGVAVSYLASVVFLNEQRLFWWAVLFGGISFWIINDKKRDPRRIFWKVLAPVCGYGAVILWFVVR